ncbi:membrane-bound lytic murein transglycosylase B [Marmoricola sp. URHA0025 HA25]
MSTGTVARAVAVVAAAGSVLLVLTVLALAIRRVGGPDASALAEGAPLATAPSAATQPARRSTAQDASRSASRPGLDQAWLARTATAAGIPVPALRAYADAELVLRAQQPGCDLSWNTLAGIGWIESQHGTIGGRTLLADGRPSTPILGPALNGTGGVAAIHSTPASAAWHGDGVWEHAVGPLQFLPSTWDTWSADGDGDGLADPGDIDDAALTAARYLCADGHDLATDAGWNAAVHSYNHDAGYVAGVAAAANTYVARTR